MSLDDETTQQSPFRRPGWIAAAVVVVSDDSSESD